MLDTISLVEAARVPLDLLPWGKGRHINAHRVRGTAFLFDAMSIAGMHQLDSPEEGYGGYVVMDDSPREVARHFNAVKYARGRILKTGLGLGCFVRMCLTMPQVEHIDVVEVDPDVADHFGSPFQSNPRITIHVADAFAWPIPAGVRWNFGWHDIYCDGNDGLQVQHMKLIKRYAPHCDLQGAWGLPRWVRRRLPRVV